MSESKDLRMRQSARGAASKICVTISSESEDDAHPKFGKRSSSCDSDWEPEDEGSVASNVKMKKNSSTVRRKRGLQSVHSSHENEPHSKRARTHEWNEDEERVNDYKNNKKTARFKNKLCNEKSVKASEERKLKKNMLNSGDASEEGTSRDTSGRIIEINEIPTSSDSDMLWKEADLLAEREGLDVWVANNLHKLFEQENTIPFIARYRKELTRNMEPEQLRHAKDTFEDIKLLKKKALLGLKTIIKMEKLTPVNQKSVLSARSLNELEHIMAPFKTGSKRTLAARARDLGLEQAAVNILEGSSVVDILSLINRERDGLRSEEEVKTGIQHIIAEIITKTVEVLDLVQHLRRNSNICLESNQAVKKNNSKGSQLALQAGKKISATEKQNIQDKLGELSKFRNYFNFSVDIKFIKPHQVLAINRGENLKELNVRFNVPEYVSHQITSFCKHHWMSKGAQYPLRSCLFDASIKDSYKRFIEPLIVRQVRADLSTAAERASIEVFASNLKKLLLTPPFRGHNVLGIDPGFRNGCKVAIVSQSGEVLETDVLYICKVNKPSNFSTDKNALWLRSSLIKHGCAIIALGNGKACRETEEYLSSLIQSGFFKPQLDVSYTIVSEQGASIYSCSEEAKKEFPGMDPNLVSAVSLARRLQDPLAELVKVDPKHLGVGMYQHDLPEKKLANTLDEVVIECVSFVGVDLNTAPQCLLRRIAGLSASKADKILEYRKNKPFTSRDEIKKVKGIGEKSYEQCAGFIRILPETVGQWNVGSGCNPLDRTWIHPESYGACKRLLDHCGLALTDFGSSQFNQKIGEAVTSAGGASYLAMSLGESENLVKLIIDGLQLPLNYDFRMAFEKPLFRKGLMSIDDISCGTVVTGKVNNTTDFGAFVDIGIGSNGLIHKSAMGRKTPQLGDRVQVKIINIEKARLRVGLQLLEIL